MADPRRRQSAVLPDLLDWLNAAEEDVRVSGFWVSGTHLADVSERSSALGRTSHCLRQGQIPRGGVTGWLGTTRVGVVGEAPGTAGRVSGSGTRQKEMLAT